MAVVLGNSVQRPTDRAWDSQRTPCLQTPNPVRVRHDPGDPFPAHGPDDVKRIVTMVRAMFPDFRVDVETVVAEGDLVVSRYTATATDTVGYMGLPPTGKAIRTSAIQMFRFSSGKIVESWAARDDLGTLRQLGHLAAPGGGTKP